jgi:hypothetical protein
VDAKLNYAKLGGKMFRRMIQMGCLSLALVTGAYGSPSDFITYEWLIDTAQKTGYTDHIPHFRRLFNTFKVRGFLECGCGFSTKYFMDNCQEVTSIEFMTKGTSDLWFNQCLQLYAQCSNWVPLAYNADLKNESFDNACGYQCSTHKDYALIDPRYLCDLDQYFKGLLYLAHRKGKDIDVAFVDAGVYIRGDMVKLFLQNNVPIVVAHDTASDVGSDVDEGLYGWFKVKTPPEYEKIFIPFGNGTTFWVDKKFPAVIESLTLYRDQMVEAGVPIGWPELRALTDVPDKE